MDFIIRDYIIWDLATLLKSNVFFSNKETVSQIVLQIKFANRHVKTSATVKEMFTMETLL